MNSVRELDPVIRMRLDSIQQSAFEAAGVVESVKGVLYAHHEEWVGDTAIIDLVNALRAAAKTLSDVTDRLDTALLLNGSRATVVRSESV